MRPFPKAGLAGRRRKLRGMAIIISASSASDEQLAPAGARNGALGGDWVAGP
jgi:hypothetical protein